MKQLLIVLIFGVYCNSAIAQITDFPQAWEGRWIGEIAIESSNASYKIPMSLFIQPIEENRWTWVLHYQTEGQETRNYELIKDSTGWNIDEKNGIVLQQQLIDNRLCSSFSVMGNLLICYYWLENNALNMEIHMVKQEASSKTGLNTEESPEVSIHLIGAFQKAVLHRK